MSTLILTHGAGGNRNAPLLVALASALEGVVTRVIRYDLLSRQKRPHGPPRPAEAADDRAGLRAQFTEARAARDGPVYAGGVSYGGRQTSMLVAEEPGLIDGLLLLSYPLHPPGKPDRPRTAHLSSLRVPTLFVHGTRDPFGSIAELEEALKLIPARVQLLPVEGVGHDLKGAAPKAAAAFREFFGL